MNWVWRRLSTVKWQDAWEERLRFAAGHMAVMRFPNSSTIRVEVYCEKLAEAELLKSAFGGTVQRCPKQPPQAALVPARTQPLRIRGKLLVVHSEKEARAARREGLPVLLIPGGMAFGTGEHATTSTCLRLLCDAAARRKGEWSLLDLGTGTGILALAAKLWGAKKCLGLDNDPAAVRTARENAQVNGIRGVVFQRADVTRWRPKERYAIVTANLYSELLIAASDQVAAAVAEDGVLILSGMLREQAPECLKVFAKKGFRPAHPLPRGKWVTCLLERGGGVKGNRLR